jgi:hypothetical protein
LKNDGSVLVWGRNNEGQTNVPVAAQSGVSGISAGYFFTMALKNDGSVVLWGDDNSGRMAVPTNLTGVAAIAGGGYHALALKSDDSVVAWGTDVEPQTMIPVGLSGVTAIAAGYSHSVALIGTGFGPVSLNAKPVANFLVLSWPTNAWGFRLQSTLNSTSPATWIDSTNPPVTVGGRFTVTNAVSGDAQFYRLRRM